MMHRIEWAYAMSMLSLLAFVLLLITVSAYREWRRSRRPKNGLPFRRNWGHLRGSHPSQFRDYKNRSR